MKALFLLIAMLCASPAIADDVQGVVYNANLRQFQGSTRTSGTVGFRQGVTDGTGPCSGCVGEEIFSSVSPSTTSLTSGSPLTTTSIVVPAGTWDLSATAAFQTGTTTSVTQYLMVVSKTTNSLGGTNSGSYANPTSGEVRAAISQAAGVPGSTEVTTVSITPYKITLTTQTTFFLVLAPTFTVSTMTGGGMIRAVRTF